jgi:hypothetical protein
MANPGIISKTRPVEISIQAVDPVSMATGGAASALGTPIIPIVSPAVPKERKRRKRHLATWDYLDYKEKQNACQLGFA